MNAEPPTGSVQDQLDPKDIMGIQETVSAPVRLLLPYPYPLLPGDDTEIHCSS